MYRCRAWALQLGLNLSPQLMPVEQSLGRRGAATTSAHKPSCFVVTAPGRLAAPKDLFLHRDRYTKTVGDVAPHRYPHCHQVTSCDTQLLQTQRPGGVLGTNLGPVVHLRCSSVLSQLCWLWVGQGQATWTPRDKAAKGLQHCSSSCIQKHISRGLLSLLYLQGESHESGSNRG